MPPALRILHLEDDPVDSELAAELLQRDGLAVHLERVNTEEGFRESLERDPPALILADYALPGVDSLEALRLARRMRPEIPFIFLSGTMGEEVAIETLRLGATDYVLKQRIGRLVPAVRRALQEAEDQSRRRQAEQERAQLLIELQAVLQQMPAGVVIANRSGRVVRVNRQAEELSGGGITTDTEVGRYPHIRAFHPDGTEFGVEDWQSVRALETGESVPPEETIMERPDGSRRTVLASSSPLCDREGRLVGAVVVFYDITDRKQAEEERRRLQEQLLESERARADIAERMTAEINHRMKNNLTLLSGVLEVQAMDLPQGAAAGHAIRDAITRLTALSAIHEQLYEARSARVDLRTVLRRIAEMDVQALTTGEVLLRVGGDATSIPSKLGSTLALIGNELISNALQYGAPGESGKLEIEVLVSRSGDGLHLRVWNSGRPVAEGFEASAQIGVGLPLVHDVIVRQLHGDFALRPDRGGTAAEVFVPEREIQEAEFVPVGEGRATPSV